MCMYFFFSFASLSHLICILNYRYCIGRIMTKLYCMILGITHRQKIHQVLLQEFLQAFVQLQTHKLGTTCGLVGAASISGHPGLPLSTWTGLMDTGAVIIHMSNQVKDNLKKKTIKKTMNKQNNFSNKKYSLRFSQLYTSNLIFTQRHNTCSHSKLDPKKIKEMRTQKVTRNFCTITKPIPISKQNKQLRVSIFFYYIYFKKMNSKLLLAAELQLQV